MEHTTSRKLFILVHACVTYDLSILLYMDADLFESQYLSGEGNDTRPEANVPLAVISK